jgi:hypothetical protein
MSALDSGYFLLAQITKWQRMGDSFRRTGPRMEMADLLPAVIVLAIVVAGIVVAVKLYQRRDFSKPCDDPGKMFRQLCAAHQLNFGSRRLLLQLAAACEMSQPAEVFVTPAAFRPSNLPPQLSQHEARIKQLAAQLF